ncbi:MAG: PEP-utilizing enzyme [Patescibacteria group bacterium]
MINPNKNLWRWGPIDGRPIYPDPWYDGMTVNMKAFSPSWPSSYSLYKKDRYSYVCEYEPLYKNAEKIFVKYILNEANFKRIYRKWRNIVKRLVNLNAKMSPSSLRSLNDLELYKTINLWYKVYSYEFWGVGLVPEIANFGGESLLRNILRKKSVVMGAEVSLMEKLSAPDKFSFYTQEEIDLLKLRKIKGKPLNQSLVKHQQKYFWILNSYRQTKVLSVDYFAKYLKKFSNVHARDRIKALKKQIKIVKFIKAKLVRQYSLGKDALMISNKLACCIWWQDNRKSYIFQTNHVIDVIVNELSRRYDISKSDLHYYVFKDILKLIKTGKKLSIKELKQRQSYFAVVWDRQKGTMYVSGGKAKKLYNLYQIKPNVKSIKQIRGEAVSAGVVKGKVRVILSAREVNKLRPGEILITTMTSPDFIVAMRKAAAVVTDVGGITSHAAIVSRELRIPCIVGTRIATKVLRNADLVEVDANKGIVKKL